MLPRIFEAGLALGGAPAEMVQATMRLRKKHQISQKGGSQTPQSIASVVLCRLDEVQLCQQPVVDLLPSLRVKVANQTCPYMFVPLLGDDSGSAEGYNLLLHGWGPFV